MAKVICLIEICHRPKDTNSKNDFCSRHEKALENINNIFQEWTIAYGEKYRKKKYLQNLLTNEDVPSGKWIKEVVKHLFEEEVSK